MAASLQGHQVHPEGRTWKSHFPNGDLWVFGYGSLIWKPPPHYGTPWLINPTADQRVPGYINGYVRRFWQIKATPHLKQVSADRGRCVLYRQAHTLTIRHSTDHRGTPEQPGRVVTVIERKFWETLDDPLAEAESQSASTGKVWGAAYHIPASHAEEVHDYLDEREIDGYSAHFTPFHAVAGADSTPRPTEIEGPGPIICMVYIGQPTNPQFLREAARREPQDVAAVISAGHGLSGKNTEYLYLLEKALQGLGLGTADVHVTDLVRRVKAIEADELAEAEEQEAEEDVKKSLASAAAGEKVHGDQIE